METVDPRILRTRKLLWDALVGLMSERGFSDISVSDVALAAGINRATFYRHFESKDDLFRQGCREILLPLAEEMSSRSPHFDDREIIASNVGHLFKLVDARRSLFLVIFRSEGNAEASSIAEDLIYDVLFKERLNALPAEPGPGKLPVKQDLLAHTMTSMMMGLMSWWIGSGAPYSAQEIAEIYAAILYGGMPSFFCPAAT
jgi:AcrR family transcriptional regulator